MEHYVSADGLRTWYETDGAGDPLVLLHGGLATNATWAGQREALAKQFAVIAPERRGHGHTPDVAGPMSYGAMAQDTVAFLEAVDPGPAHLVGWSDGAVVALLVALKRPELVRKLVLLGGAFDTSGWVPQFEPATWLPADSPLFEPFRVAYEAVSPDGPDHWPVVFAKATEMWRAEPHIPKADLAQLQARTLTLVGDDDLTTLEHATEMYRAIPDGELAVIPGASHFALMEKPDLVNRVIVDFLTQDRVPTLMPVRRATPGAG